ncbi:hypothetical protein DID73_02490 [Candidatus Marinamargulisbacteria bacterium SCGC AG-343-K17]|nr:hypothetical protein DID73_02490 [Candidatus Marinamargulisbacteria bacterium SCGC AG-343-K17]
MPPPKKVVEEFNIINFHLTAYPCSMYVFTGTCWQCNHLFEINTNVTLLIDFNTPCPSCFNFCQLNSLMVQAFLSRPTINSAPLNPRPFSIPQSLMPIVPRLMYSYGDFLASLLFLEENK